jgi:hypothetical protein
MHIGRLELKLAVFALICHILVLTQRALFLR